MSVFESNQCLCVAMHHGLALPRIGSRKLCVFKHVLELADAIGARLHHLKLKITADKQLAPDTASLREHERVAVFPDENNTLALIRMSQIRENDFHTGPLQCHRLAQLRQREPWRRMRDAGWPEVPRKIPGARVEVEAHAAASMIRSKRRSTSRRVSSSSL